MKAVVSVFVTLLLVSLNALAIDIKPYDAATFERLRLSGQQVALHFHADWCPVCRAQERVFKSWRGDASIPGTLLVVDYDKARELRRELGVRSQSVIILYKGGKETTRVGGMSDADDLRAVFKGEW